MKKHGLYVGMATLFAATQLFSACSSDEFDNQTVTPSGKSISLTTSLALTRGTGDPQATRINTAVKVGAFGVSGEATIANGDNNAYSVDANGDLNATNNMTWPTEGDVSIFAYAPYKEGWKYNEANAFTVATDQSTDAGYLASDLLYGVPSQNPVAQTENAVNLGFTHKLAKIKVTIQKVEGATLDLTNGSVTITNTLTSTTLNPSTGATGTATGAAADIKAVAKLGTETTAQAIIVPQELAAGTQLVKIIADGKQLNAKLGSNTTFVGGKSYNFTVKVGKVEQPVTEVTLELGSTSVANWDDESLGEAESEEGEIEPITLTATFGTPGNNASYSAPTYTWTAGNSNLMTVFEFSNGELANYHTLKFKFTNLTEGASVRMGYYVGSDFTEFGNGFYSAGEKTVDLTALGIDLSTVTKIAFGGRSGAGGSCDIVASDVVLIGNGDGSSSTGDDNGGTTDSSTLTATFGTPGGNASYDAPTYTWTASSNNLMTVFEFSNGELANYTKLTFTFSNLVDGPVRMGYYVGSTFTEFGNGYYNAGTKEVDLTALGIDLSTVTKISFGGRSNAGSCDILATDVVLSK